MKKEIISGENWEKRDFIDASFIMSMPVGKHIVLVQNFMNRPILSDTPRFFEEPEIARRVYNLRTGKGPKPALPMPGGQMQSAAEKGKQDEVRKRKMQDLRSALAAPEVAIVCTPDNIAQLSFDFETETFRLEPGTDFAVARVRLTDEDRFFDPPPEEDVVVTSDPEALEEIVQGRKVYIFDDGDFDALNAVLAEGGRDEVPRDLKMQMRTPALDMDNEEDGNFFTVGYYGTARCDRPDDLSILTPTFAHRWMCEIVNVVHACEYEFKRMSVG